MSEQRKLATIMGIDVAGYSHAAEVDDGAAAEAIQRVRVALDEVIAPSNGRVFSTAGDGFMVEFPAAASGVAAARALLALVRERALPRIRIGLHLGDVIVEQNGDLLGHGVNVAARLMQMAEPNTAVVSHAVQSQMRAAADVEFKPLGRVQLDKMSERVEVFALGAPGARFARVASRQRRLFVRLGAGVAIAAGVIAIALLSLKAFLPAPQGTPRLAVMRFDNLGTTDAALAESVADELISEVSHTPGLDVIARSSSFVLTDAQATPANVARELGASLMLTGSVQRDGNTLRVHADLVEAPNGRVLWTRSFERPMEEILALEHELAVEVARSVGIRIELTHARRVDPEAYALYVRGREIFLHRIGAPGRAREAFELFHQAVQRDPTFAQAWVWYGTAGGQAILDENPDAPPTLQDSAVLVAADHLQRLEPTWADASSFRAYAFASVGRWRDAVREQRRTEALGGFGFGRWQEFMGAERRVIASWRHDVMLNPENENMHAWFGHGCILAGEYAAAIDEERRALELNPNHPDAIVFLFDALRRTDREAARRLLTQYPGAWRAAAAFDPTNARPYMAQLIGAPLVPTAEIVRLYRTHRTPVRSAIWSLAHSGRTAAAADLLAEWGPDFDLEDLFDPNLGDLRRTPQFWALMQRKGLVQYWSESHDRPDFCANESVCTQHLRH